MFKKQAHHLFERLVLAFEENFPGDYDESDTHIELKNRGKTYVFNIHNTSEQVWLASPISGGRHFYCTSDHQWQDTRNQESLSNVLKEELDIILSLSF